MVKNSFIRDTNMMKINVSRIFEHSGVAMNSVNLSWQCVSVDNGLCG